MLEALRQQSSTTLDIVHAEDGPPITQRTSGRGGIGVMTESNKRTSIQKRTSRHREVECPKCKAQFLFRRARLPHFDRHGFESYELSIVLLRRFVDWYH